MWCHLVDSFETLTAIIGSSVLHIVCISFAYRWAVSRGGCALVMYGSVAF